MGLQKLIFNSTIFKAICSAIGYLSFALLSFFVAVFVTAVACCSNKDQLKVFDTVYTPDGKLKAVVFADVKTPESKNISVLGAKSILEKNRVGNVFSETCQFVRAKWMDNHKLLIYCDGENLSNRESYSFVAFDRDIQIEYRELKGE